MGCWETQHSERTVTQLQMKNAGNLSFSSNWRASSSPAVLPIVFRPNCGDDLCSVSCAAPRRRHAQILAALPESVCMCVCARASLDVHNLCMTGNVVYAESWHSCFTVTTLFFTLSTVSGRGSPPVHSYPQPPCVYLCSLSRSVLSLACKFTARVCSSCVSLCFWPFTVDCLLFCTYQKAVLFHRIHRFSLHVIDRTTATSMFGCFADMLCALN